MTFLPFAVLLAAAASAAPQPPAASDPPRPGIDPGTLSPQARARYEADPAAFEREHGDDLAVLRRWSQDPSLGQSECLAEKREPRSCMESRLTSLREVAKPEQLAVVQSYVKLLPRGVSAPLPAAPSERAGAPTGSAPASASPPPAASPAPARAASAEAPRRSGARFNAAPAPTQAPEAPPPAAGGGAVQDWMDWFCARFSCART